MKKFQKYRFTPIGRFLIFLFFVSPISFKASKFLQQQKPFVNISVNRATTATVSPSIVNQNTTALDVSQLQKVRVRTDTYVALNLREAPSLGAPVIIQIPHKSIAYLIGYDEHKTSIDGKTGRWCQISYGGYTGWAYGAYLFLMD